MDSLTGKRRKAESSLAVAIASLPNSTKDFVPELYKSATSKKFRTEQPENEEERQIMKALPCDAEATILHIRKTFPVSIFNGTLPQIILYSQLRAILSNQFLVDTQLSKLAKENKIITFSTFTSSTYLIVLLEDFVNVKRDGIFERFVNQVISNGDNTQLTSSYCANSRDSEHAKVEVQRSVENSKYFSKEDLRRIWKFEEDEIRQLINAGYLGVQEGGMYCISLPGAGKFIKCYEKGKKAVIGAIKRSKFGEILQSELEQRPMKKSAPLGVLYHMYDLIGSGEITKVDTTSGPLLRIKRES